MTGVSTPTLTIAVSNVGALGALRSHHEVEGQTRLMDHGSRNAPFGRHSATDCPVLL